jgi:arylsulfatase A-like enzyme/Tfp pilus assembly protein PilF
MRFHVARRRLALLAALAAGCLAGCADSAPRSVVLISIDTLRADRLGCYGNPDGLTPNLDRLAAEGVVFTDATAPTPVTLPSHTSLMTGRYPTATGVRNNGTFVVPESEETLAERLKREGWRTGAVVAAYPLVRRYGLDQGFDLYDDRVPGLSPGTEGLAVHFPERRADEVTDRALAAWNALGAGSRLLWVHYFDPHAPYDPPGERAETQAGRYDGEVAFADREIGRLLDAVLADDPDAVIAVVSDHGEGLGDHGEKTHGIFVYQSTLHVPLLVRAPGRLPAGRRVGAPVSLVDVAPTLLALAGLSSGKGVEGIDLTTLLDAEPPDRVVYAESHVPRLEYRFSELRALRRGGLKLIDAPEPELYDLAADPGELRPLDEPALDQELLADLRGFIEESEALAGDAVSTALDAESAAALRSLGYLAAGAPERGDGDRRRDPKMMTDWFLAHDKALGAISAGRFEEGMDALERLREAAPENYLVGFQLAGAALAAGRPERAERELDAVLEQEPTFVAAHHLRAEALRSQGRLDDAVLAHRAAAAASPDPVDALLQLGGMLQQAGRFAPAAGVYREAIGRRPDLDAPARRLLELRQSRGEQAEAAGELRELAQTHGSAALWSVAASAEQRLGNPEAALGCVERALAADPANPAALLLLGEIRLDTGRAAEAEAAFRRALESRPRSVAAHFGLERALLTQGKTAAADVLIEWILALDPSFSHALTARGLFREQAGDPAGAASDYARALRIDPNDRRAAEGERRLTVQPR